MATVKGYDDYKKAIAKCDYKGILELKQTRPQSYEQYKTDYQRGIARERAIHQDGYYFDDFITQSRG